MRCLFLFAALFLYTGVYCQISLPSNTIITENFNALGSSAAALPDNWKMSAPGSGQTATWSSGTNVTTLTQAANSGSPTAAGRYNWGTINGVDRAAGFMTSAGYASPNALMAWYQNSTGTAVTSITVQFELERYRINTDPFLLDFFYSVDGNSWTAHSEGAVSALVFVPGVSSYSFDAPSTIVRTVTISGLNIASGGSIYFKWVFNSGNNSQGVALDNVSVFAGPPTPVLIATLQDQISLDGGIQNQANEGDQLRYTTTLRNTGTGDAENVLLTSPAPLNTTLVPGSLKTSALARNDFFQAEPENLLFGSNVLTNDFGVPDLTVVSFGPSGNSAAVICDGSNSSRTDNGGEVVLNTDGTFVYIPPSGFIGYDRFSYIAATGTLPNSEAVVTIEVGSPVSASNDSYNVIGNVSISPNAVQGVLFNDGGDGKRITSVNGNSNSIGVPVTTAQGGTIMMNADGSFSYNPPAGYEGADQFNYTIDNGFGAPKTASVSLNIGGMIWFINNGGSPGDGRLSSPFNSVSAFQAANNGLGNNPAAGDYIFVFENAAPYPSSSITLLQGQKLIGQDASQSLAAITGYTAALYSASLPVNNPGGNAANLSNAGVIVNLSASGNNLVQGLTLSPTAGSAVSLTGTATGNHTAADLIITASGTANGVNLSTTSYNGTLNYLSGSISSTGTGTAFNVSGNTATITCSASVTQAGGGTMVNVTNHSAGTIIFQTGTLNASSGNGLQFSNADGSYNFNGTTILNGGDAGIDILNGSDGSFTFSANTTIVNPSGTAFNVDGTTTAVRASVIYNGAITQNTSGQRLVNVNTTGAGALIFQNGTITAGAGSTGVNINNANGNVNFANGLSLGSGAARMTSQAITIAGGSGIYHFGNLNVFTNGVSALVATNADGTISSSAGTIDASNGSAVTITGPAGITTLAMTLTSVNSSGGANNLSLVNCDGTAALGSGSLSNASATAFNVSGGNATITYAGIISKSGSGRLVDIQNRTGNNITVSGALSSTGSSTGINISGNSGGVIDLSGSSKVLNTGTNPAVTLSSNTGASINFSNGGLSITTSSGNGFSASGGGTVNVTGSANTITSPTGTALTVSNTTIGASGLTFQSISSAGSSSLNGIVLNNTGAVGGLTVTGAGTPGSGGTIANKSGTDGSTTSGIGIYLNNTKNPSFTRMQLNDHQNFAIFGSSVNGFTLVNTVVNGSNGTSAGADEGSVCFNGITGTASVSGCTISGGFEDNLRVTNSSGTLNRLTISGCTFNSNGSSGNDAVLLDASGNAILNATVQTNTFTSSRVNHIAAVFNGSSAGDIIVDGNTISNNHPNKLGSDFGILLSHVSYGAVTYSVNNNSVRDAGGSGIEISKLAGGTGSLTGSITNNRVGVSGLANSGSDAGSCIVVGLVGAGETATHSCTVSGNTIRQYTNYGIRLINRGTGAGYLNAVVQNNNIAEPSPNAALFGAYSGIRAELGASSTGPDDGKSCLTITGNVLNQTGSSLQADLRIFGRFSTKTAIPGFSGNVNTYLQNNNTITVAPGGAGAVNATSTNPFQSTCPPL